MWKTIGVASALALLGLALLAGAAWFGGWVGWRLHEEAVDRGCINLSADVTPVEVTPAEPTRVRFAALGDTGTGNAGAHRVAAALRQVCAQEGCDFVALLGDNFYPNGVHDADDPLFESAFESVYAGLDVPVLPILGNHDVKQPVISQLMHSRESALWRMPNYEYAFRAGPARFFAINTNCAPVVWWRLADGLAEPYTGWTFVLGHHALYGEGPHGDASWAVLWMWADLAGQVDFYLSGHNHLLEHLQREGERTDYVVSGSGGAAMEDPSRFEKPSAASLRFEKNVPGFAWLDVTPQQVTLRFYDDTATAIYESVRTREAGR